MEDCVDEGGRNIRLEKRHIQDELDFSDSSPSKLMTTPRRSRDKTSVGRKNVSGTRSDKVSLDEISERMTRSSSRTPVEKRSARKTRSSNRALVEQRRACKTESSNRKLLEKKSARKSRSSSKTPVERSASRTRSSYSSPVLGKRASKTRLFNQIPVEDINTSKTELPNRSSVQEKSSNKRRSFNRSPVQEERTIKIRCSNIIPEPEMDINKSSSSSFRTPLQENFTGKTKTSCRTPQQERSARNLMLSDRPLVHCTSGAETRSSDKTPLNGRIVKASRIPHNFSLDAKEIESHDHELKMELELKERKRRQVAQEQNIKQKHQGDSYLTDAKKNHSGDVASSLKEECVIGTSDDSEVDSLSSDIDKDIQREVEKVKKRRSTIGRGHMSSHSLGGRQSLCASFSLLSLEDQISRINEGLPWTSKVSCLVDISVREALRRLEARLPGNEFVTDLRVDLLTKYENLCGQIAYKVADYPMFLEAALPNTSHVEEVKASTIRIAAYKKRTKELEQEYKNWKILMKERKLACQTAEREFREAKSGEKKIEDDQTNQLTLLQRNIMSSRPNYHHYIQEIQMVHEKAVLMFQEVKLATDAVSSLITAYTVKAESCYAAVDEVCFGYLKNQSTKTNLASLLQRSHTVSTDASEP